MPEVNQAAKQKIAQCLPDNFKKMKALHAEM